MFELVEYIRSINPDIKLSLTTNGKIIDKDLMNKIINNFDWITFSIDSSNSKINEMIGRGCHHLNKIEELLNLCNNRIKIKINTVATKINVDDLENIYNIISKYNISRWKIMRFYPLRKGKESKNMFYLEDSLSAKVASLANKLDTISRFHIHYNDLSEFTSSYFNIYPDGSY